MATERAKENQTMLQAHMNEYPGEINFYMERKQLRPYEYLDSLGVLGPDFLGAHSLLLSESAGKAGSEGLPLSLQQLRQGRAPDTGAP